MTGPLVSCGTSAATYGPRSGPSCRRRGVPVTPCSTPDEAQTFQISRRELFSHLRRRASARLAPDPEGRTRQRQAAIDRSNAGHPNEDRRPAEDGPADTAERPDLGVAVGAVPKSLQEYRSGGSSLPGRRRRLRLQLRRRCTGPLPPRRQPGRCRPTALPLAASSVFILFWEWPYQAYVVIMTPQVQSMIAVTYVQGHRYIARLLRAARLSRALGPGRRGSPPGW